MAFDTIYQYVTSNIDTEANIRYMKDSYADAVNESSPNAPKPKRKTIHINCFVNSDNDGDRVTRRSQTDILIYFNSASIIFYSNRQNTT